jgi:hypothetical protein
MGLAFFTAAGVGAANTPPAGSGSPASGAAALSPSWSAGRTPTADGMVSSGLPATAMNSELLKGLIAQANQEGSLSVETVFSVLPASNSVKNAFLEYFQPMGLSLDVRFAGGSQTTDWKNAQDAINGGSAPQFDLLLGNGATQVYPFLSITAPIDDWQALLTVVNPDAARGRSSVVDYSPAPFTGQALLFSDYYTVLAYSSQVDTYRLPSKLADLADPKYKDRFVVSAFATDALYKLAVIYGKDEALEW